MSTEKTPVKKTSIEQVAVPKTSVKKISVKNAAYQQFEVLKTNRNKRHKQQLFLVEGVRNINEAVRHHWPVQAFLFADDRALSAWALDLLNRVPVPVHYRLSAPLMDALSEKEDASELIALVRMRAPGEGVVPTPPNPSANPLIALFDRPSNKGNLGTMLRSCDALGVEGLLITGHAVDVYDPEVIRASMGSFFHVPFATLSSNADIDAYIARIKAQYPALRLVGTTAHHETRLPDVDLTAPVLFLIGNETDGLNQHFQQMCDVKVTIPMHPQTTASSFNVSCAATVLFYEAARQRGFR